MSNYIEEPEEKKGPECISCGKKAILKKEGRFGFWEGICHYPEGAYCDDCYKKVIDKYIEEFDGDTDYTDNVVCPRCGYEHIDCFEWEEDGGETKCVRCNHEFLYERNSTIYYSSKNI